MKRLLFPFTFFIILITSCSKDVLTKFHPIVNTDGYLVDSISSTEDTFQITGSASDKDGRIVGYLWSLVSGPSVPVFSSPGSASTTISMVNEGMYIFQLSATDNDGLTGYATDTVIVVLKQPKTVVLKNDATTANEMLLAGNNVSNYSDGGSPEIDAYNWTQHNQVDLGKGLFKFDLSVIPATKIIKSAKLSLYSNPTPQNGNQKDANYGNNNSMFIERVTSPWNNLTTTWATQPSTETEDHIIIPQSNKSKEDLIDIDVTSLVQKMVSETNYGFEIRLQSNEMYNSRLFCGSRYSDPTKHPVLTVTY